MIEIMPILKTLWIVFPGIVFIGIALWAYWPANRGYFEAQAQIPLRNDVGEEH